MHVGTLTSSFQETWQLASKYRRIGSFLMQSVQANLRIQFEGCRTSNLHFAAIFDHGSNTVGRQYNVASKGSMIHPYPLIGNNNLFKVSAGLFVTSCLMLTKQCALTTAAYRL